MYHTNIPNSYFMADEYGQFCIIDNANTRNSSKQIKIIDKIRNKSSAILISQIDDKIIQANYPNNIYSTTSLCICGICMLMFTVYHIPIFPMLF